MKKLYPVDDLFRRDLKGYELTPSEERRKIDVQDALKDVGQRSSKRRLILGSVAGLLLLAGLGFLILESGHEAGQIEKHFDVRKDNKNEGQKTHPQAKETQSISNFNTNLKEELTAIPSSQNQDIKNNIEISNNTAIALQESDVNAKTKEEEAVVKTGIEKEANVNSSTTTDEKEIVKKSREKNSLPKQWKISAGISCTPEWMFNTLNGDKFVNNMAMEGTFHFGPYSIRTGVGMSITRGYNEILVKTNPYLGTYSSLDSVVFRWDEKHDALIPTIYTSKTHVYDTALHYNYSNIQKRYTYLQIPLVLGYDFWQNKWLSLGMRAGAVMSLLLKVETLTAAYDAGKDRIVSINDISPDRIQLNWQAMGGFSMAFRLSRRFSLELEPEVRYYFNSVYESSVVSKKPWSTGVRSAFLISF